MEFCPECDGILLPKKGTNELYCRICGKTYKMAKKKSAIKKEYRIKRKIGHKVSGKTAIIEKKASTQSISEEDRRAYEDFFSGDGS